MKVLFLASRFAPHLVGGAERVTETLAKGLASVGHEIVVLTTAFEGDSPERMVDGIRVRSIPLRNLYDFTRPAPRALKAGWHLIDSSNPWMKTIVSGVLREERPDVMHSHLITGFSPSAWDAAVEIGVPIVHTLHDHYVICARSSMAMDGIPCQRQHLECALLSKPRIRSARGVDAVVGVSKYVLNRHREFGAFQTNSSHVIPNPCHLVGSDHRTPATVRGVAGAPVRMGFLGRLEQNKGVDLLVEASRQLPRSGWTLSIAGSGEPSFAGRIRKDYEAANVSFVGNVEPSAFLSQIDLLVVPSKVPETFGMSAAEALALGVPVVASTVGALPELIQDGRNGFLFDPFTAGALDQLLARVVTNPSMIQGMSDRCRESVASLAVGSVVQRYADVYEDVARR